MAKKTKYPTDRRHDNPRHDNPRHDNPKNARESRNQQTRKPKVRSDKKRGGMRQGNSSDACPLDIHSLAVRMYCALDKVADYVDALRVVPFDDREEVQAYCEEFRSALWRAYADLLRLITDLERAFHAAPEPQTSHGIVIAFPSRGDKP